MTLIPSPTGIAVLVGLPFLLPPGAAEEKWTKEKERDKRKGKVTKERYILKGAWLAQEVWEDLPWGRAYKWINRLPVGVHTLYRRNGGSSR